MSVGFARAPRDGTSCILERNANKMRLQRDQENLRCIGYRTYTISLLLKAPVRTTVLTDNNADVHPWSYTTKRTRHNRKFEPQPVAVGTPPEFNLEGSRVVLVMITPASYPYWKYHVPARKIYL